MESFGNGLCETASFSGALVATSWSAMFQNQILLVEFKFRLQYNFIALNSYIAINLNRLSPDIIAHVTTTST